MAHDPAEHAADDLEALARRRFGNLSEAEKRLVQAMPQGDVAYCGTSEDDNDPANDPADADGTGGKSKRWDNKRRIRADLIRWLCVNPGVLRRTDPRGIRIHAAAITGGLDLSFATVPFPLTLNRCRLAAGGNFESVTIPRLELDGSWTGSLAADSADVRGDISLANGFSAVGGVSMLGAQIGGDLNCAGGTLRNPGGDALVADDSEIKGSVLLTEGFSAVGEVRMLGAQIRGDLNCSRGTVRNLGGYALAAEYAEIKGRILLTDGFSAVGEVQLGGAQVGREIDCSDASFKNPGGRALSAEGIEVKGDVSFTGEKFSAEGEVGLSGAQIGGDLECERGSFSSLNLYAAIVKKIFSWYSMQNARSTHLDLRNASVGLIHDDNVSWPEKGNLLLDGLVYERITGGPTGAEERLNWLDRQSEFKPQPYRQLAKVLRELGDDDGAKQVLFELEKRVHADDRKRIAHAPFRWFRFSEDIVSNATVGYGIYPARAVWYLCGLTAMGWIVHRRAQRVGAMAPIDKDAYAEFHDNNGKPPARYQPFSPLIYSVENCIPLVKLGQDERWQPDPNPQRVVSPVAQGKFRGVVDSALDFVVRDWAVTPVALRWIRWILIGLGWLLATFFVAGLTGFIKVG